MNRFIRPTVDDDIRFVADHMRIEDVEEVLAQGSTPFDGLVRSRDNSTLCHTLIEPDGTPCALLGICPGYYAKSGLIWLLGTQGIERNPITFLRHSKSALTELFEAGPYDFLYNYTYAKNQLHHKWLKWLGFKFLRTVEIPPFNKSFIEFVKIRD
jgi:hypothetical protein